MPLVEGRRGGSVRGVPGVHGTRSNIVSRPRVRSRAPTHRAPPSRRDSALLGGLDCGQSPAGFFVEPTRHGASAYRLRAANRQQRRHKDKQRYMRLTVSIQVPARRLARRRKGAHAPLDRSASARMRSRSAGRAGSCISPFGRRMRSASRSRRFQRLGRPPASDECPRRERHLVSLRARRWRPARATNSRSATATVARSF